LAEPSEDKRRLRRAVRARLLALAPAERRAASAAAAGRLLELPELRSAGAIALYAAHHDEADPGLAVPTLAGWGKRLVFPRVSGDDLEFAEAGDVVELRPGGRGLLEPRGEPIDVWEIDAVVVPGVAFDAAGGRLGRGGGHYDRILPRLRPGVPRIGFCFGVQVVERVPRTWTDQPVDLVVTELGVIRAASVASGSP
jgi:5-formyltetrahydrofolate cyclo-ligase